MSFFLGVGGGLRDPEGSLVWFSGPRWILGSLKGLFNNCWWGFRVVDEFWRVFEGSWGILKDLWWCFQGPDEFWRVWRDFLKGFLMRFSGSRWVLESFDRSLKDLEGFLLLVKDLWLVFRILLCFLVMLRDLQKFPIDFYFRFEGFFYFWRISGDIFWFLMIFLGALRDFSRIFQGFFKDLNQQSLGLSR